jgi:hypothetical protein
MPGDEPDEEIALDALVEFIQTPIAKRMAACFNVRPEPDPVADPLHFGGDSNGSHKLLQVKTFGGFFRLEEVGTR